MMSFFTFEIVLYIQRITKLCYLLRELLNCAIYEENYSIVLYIKRITKLCYILRELLSCAIYLDWFGCMVFNATFNNISVISWQSLYIQIGFVVWCLMPLSTIFQLYRDYIFRDLLYIITILNINYSVLYMFIIKSWFK